MSLTLLRWDGVDWRWLLVYLGTRKTSRLGHVSIFSRGQLSLGVILFALNQHLLVVLVPIDSLSVAWDAVSLVHTVNCLTWLGRAPSLLRLCFLTRPSERNILLAYLGARLRWILPNPLLILRLKLAYDRLLLSNRF